MTPAESSVATGITITAARSDIARCLADGRARDVDLGTVLLIVGPPRIVAHLASIEACECSVLAAGVNRAAFVADLRTRNTYAQRVADDLEAPLAHDHVRLLVIHEDTSCAVATMPAEFFGPSVAVFHVCHVRGVPCP